MFPLRPYQTDGVNGIRKAYLDKRRAPIYVLPTGGGKTVVFCYIAANSATRGKRVMILVHRVELTRQTSAKLASEGVAHGVIQSGFTPNPHAHVQVASVQTLVKRLDKIKFPPDLIIVDEAHHATAGSWMKIINAFPQARILGVTATPERGDGVGLGIQAGGIFDDLIMGPTVSELIRGGFLVKPVVYAPSERLDLSGLHTRAGDYVKDELQAIMDKPTITGSAVEHYRRLCSGDPAVAFCVSILHAKHVAEEFRQAGYRAASADGTMKDEDRTRVLNGLANGQVQVLTTCDLISEGTDIPAIACAILLRPTQSTGLFLQQVGRALRPAPGKTQAIILDHVGNVLMHGLPDEDREWSLDGREKKKKRRPDDPPPERAKQCPSCFRVHEPGPSCPYCGHIYTVDSKPDIEQTEGELRLITEQEEIAIKRNRAHEVGKARTLEDLQAIGKKRGYKPGWARFIWDARQKKAEGYRYGT